MNKKKRRRIVLDDCYNLQDIACLVYQIILEYGHEMTYLEIDAVQDHVLFETVEVLE